MDESSVTQSRRSRRSQVMLQATLETPDISWEVVLRNLSQDGALVSGKLLPKAGDRVVFHRQGLSVPSRVAWVESSCAGLSFDFPLFPKELLRHVPPKQDKPPPVIGRRPGLAPKPLTDGERKLVERWASDSPLALGS